METSAKAVDFERIFSKLPGLYLILLPDLIITAVSDAYLLATMTKREEITGRYLFDVFPDNPEDEQANGASNLHKSLQRVIDEKQADTMPIQKYDIRHPGGQFEIRYWSPINTPVLSEEGEVIYLIHRVEDVTAFIRSRENNQNQKKENTLLRNELEKISIELFLRGQEVERKNVMLDELLNDRTSKLVNNKINLKSSLDRMLEGVQVIDRNWCYSYINEKALEQSRYTREELLGYTMMERYPGIEETALFRILQECMATGIPQRLENEFLYPDNSTRYFELSIQPIIEGLFILSVDITARKQAEEEIQKLNDELEVRIAERTKQLLAANKELESFSYSVSHDMRAPLRVIHGYTQILQEDYSAILDTEGKRILKIISNNVARMGQLIDDLLSFSRLGKQEIIKGRFDMTKLVESVLSELKPLYAGKSISVDYSGLLPGFGDHSMIRVVMMNLISNALKYSSKKEKIIVRIGSVTEGNTTVFFVKDNGAGFDMRYYDKLFGVFQRLHSITDFDGTGVGLAIAQRIVTKHDGKIWAESEEENGATFYFSLPNTDPN